MKKLFLAVAFLATTIMAANAGESKFWKFTTDPGAVFGVNYTVEGLTLVDASATKDWSYTDDPTKSYTVGDETFNPGSYVKTNASSYADVTAGTAVDPFSYKALYFTFRVDAASNISVYGKSGSSENREVYILDVTNNVVLTAGVFPSDGTKTQISATTTGAAVIVIAGGSTPTTGDGAGGSNTFYGVKATNVDITYVPASSKDAIASDLLKKVGSELVNPTNLDVEVYSVSGVKVLSSSAASISVSGLANGAYIAKTAEGTLKFVK